MTEHRIQFMTPLVRAIRAGVKDVTRRPIRDEFVQRRAVTAEPSDRPPGGIWTWLDEVGHALTEGACLYGGPGDVLAICEELRRSGTPTEWAGGKPVRFATVYGCDGEPVYRDGGPAVWPWQNKVQTARYCPDWAVRLRLPLVSVRPERVTAITDAEAVREGLAYLGVVPTRDAFLSLWDRMYAKGPHAAARDPWVWRLEFEKPEVSR